MIVKKTLSGYEIKALKGSEMIRRLYIGYSRQEAIARFKQLYGVHYVTNT